MQRFENKIALVTGSTQGLGEAIARRFVAEGCRGIVITGRDAGRGEAVAGSLRDGGADVLFAPAELADIDQVQSLITSTDRHFGRIDVLVNAAAITWRGSIIDTDVALWDTLMNINVRAPFFLTQGAVKVMRREGIAGSIVNIGSVAGYGAQPFLAPYAISKGALVPFTKNVAYALARDRIRINTLMIGWMDTPGEDAVQRRFHGADDEWLARAEAGMPFGRLLKPDEVAAAVAFLASDDSGMMTGAIIDFDQSVIGAGDTPKISPEEVPT